MRLARRSWEGAVGDGRIGSARRRCHGKSASTGPASHTFAGPVAALHLAPPSDTSPQPYRPNRQPTGPGRHRTNKYAPKSLVGAGGRTIHADG